MQMHASRANKFLLLLTSAMLMAALGTSCKPKTTSKKETNQKAARELQIFTDCQSPMLLGFNSCLDNCARTTKEDDLSKRLVCVAECRKQTFTCEPLWLKYMLARGDCKNMADCKLRNAIMDTEISSYLRQHGDQDYQDLCESPEDCEDLIEWIHKICPTKAACDALLDRIQIHRNSIRGNDMNK